MQQRQRMTGAAEVDLGQVPHRASDPHQIAAGIERGQAYVTNAVKHFKWIPAGERGKRRLHQKPNAREIAACRPWLLAEIEAVQPQVIVCLGATAAQSLLGGGFRVTQHRGAPVPSPFAARVVATVHPSSILRARDDDTRQRSWPCVGQNLSNHTASSANTTFVSTGVLQEPQRLFVIE